MKTSRQITLAVLLLLGPGIAASGADAGAASSLLLLRGNINGQNVSPDQRKVLVAPGASITGSLTVSINSSWPSFCVMAIGVTPTWGEHASSYIDLGHFSTPVAGLERTFNVRLTAPSRPGTYHVIAAFSATFTAGQVMSCTNWSVGHEVWNNGDDIAEWPAFIIDSANAAGTVRVPCLTPTGEVPSYVPATAIEIGVSTTAPRNGPQSVGNEPSSYAATEWVGFENSPNKDRENELRSHVGQFRRVTADGNFLDLCRSVGEECVQVRDWQGRDFTCEGGSNPGHDGSRLALCKRMARNPAGGIITLGQTPDEVIAILGQPKSIVDIGVKKIYFYNELKVTFTGGKLSSVQ